MNQQDHLDLTYRLTFNSAFHCGTGLPNGLIHRAVQKNREGYLYVPGSTIKGVLRETCEYLARTLLNGKHTIRDPHDEKAAIQAFFEGTDMVESIFGSRFQEGALFFDQAEMIAEHRKIFKNGNNIFFLLQTENRTQTRISRLLGTGVREALYSSEFGIAGLQFEGKIHGWVNGISNPFSDLSGSYALYLLIAGLFMTDRIGANRSTGMG